MVRDISRKPLYLVVFTGLLLLYLTCYTYLQSDLRGPDRPECRVVYMYPSYARIRSFDESHTKYASKFSLYLYREQGLDTIPEDEKEGFEALDGIPALFIPGNAGSYRQVRSIAAEVSNLYFDENINVVNNPNMKNYDFFGADFNEDYTAFHGRTLIDQAEYLNEAISFILLLYANNPNPPTSVLILAHSMGGIVARVLPTLPNYVPGSINTIVTLSSPHSAAPLTFDGDILKVYLAVDRFWYEAFDNNSVLTSARDRLQDVSLVSITGGALDSILPADYTTLGFLVPPSNGFTVFTSGIPHVWTPMDHLAIVWCRQLRRQVLKLLLDIADVTSPQRTYPLEKRMAIMKKHLLSGFESYSGKNRLFLKPDDRLFEVQFDTEDSRKHADFNAMWSAQRSTEKVHIFPLSSDSVIQILSESKLNPVNVGEELSSAAIFLCTNAGNGTNKLNVSTSESPSTLHCFDLSDKLNPIPRSNDEAIFLLDSSFDGELSPFYALTLGPEDLSLFDLLLVIKDQSLNQLVIQLSNLQSCSYEIGGDLLSLVWRGAKITIPSGRPMAINLNFPGAWSSVLAYKITYSGFERSNASWFNPFIRQWRDWPFETKWYINADKSNQAVITIHGIAPFTPFMKKNDSRGLNLEIWANPFPTSHEESLHISLNIDWLQSLKLLVLRYRLAVVSQCFAVTLAVLLFQILAFQASGRFPDYNYGLQKLCDRRHLVPLFLILLGLTPVTRIPSVQAFLNMIDPVVLQDQNEINFSLHQEFNLNSFFLGLEEVSLSFFGCVFFLMAVSLNFIIYNILSLLQRIISHIVPFAPKPEEIKDNEIAKLSSSVVRRLIGTAIVLVLVPIYLPYQFAFMVSFVIQVITTLKVLLAKAPRSTWNYHMSVLMVMLTVLPINVPVLIVFVHNLNIKWATPFSSHHNLLAVAPILILAELHSFYPNTIPFSTNTGARASKTEKFSSKITLGLLLYTAAYGVIYGCRHTYWLHHLFNFWCGWNTILLVNILAHDNTDKRQ